MAGQACQVELRSGKVGCGRHGMVGSGSAWCVGARSARQAWQIAARIGLARQVGSVTAC